MLYLSINVRTEILRQEDENTFGYIGAIILNDIVYCAWLLIRLVVKVLCKKLQNTVPLCCRGGGVKTNNRILKSVHNAMLFVLYTNNCRGVRKNQIFLVLKPVNYIRIIIMGMHCVWNSGA